MTAVMGWQNIVYLNGKIYFVGKDVAYILEYQNGSRDINRYVDDGDITVVAIHDGSKLI